jgi:formylglycine-generating enzyme required for sulfatase activity
VRKKQKSSQTETAQLESVQIKIADPNPGNRSEAYRLLSMMKADQRPGIGLRPDGLPDIDWVEIPAGDFIYQTAQQRTLPTYAVARYPITYVQFQTFLDAPDGFNEEAWWAGLTPEYQKQPMDPQKFQFANHPRESVSWYQAVAFCRWLSAKLGTEIRLPTEPEWEKAARGTDGRQFPWGNSYVSGYANIDETDRLRFGEKVGENFVGQTTAVGIYPQGASPYGVLDMAGNVWEWCLNEYRKPEIHSVEGNAPRALRGGSWYTLVYRARCVARHWFDPQLTRDFAGFRVVSSHQGGS